ncbi:MAG: hypothetical protein M0Z53_11825 [Thermaerobacter sp.]|nr:hypothetical protein [Thermaerobacter sp.]
MVVGNGLNDQQMFHDAELAIGVVGPEGAVISTLVAADIVVSSIENALTLLLSPTRLVTTLRE